jgi:hypothetical protein
MKLFTGWVMSAGLILTAATANAQGLAPQEIGGPRYTAVSDIGGPYAAMPSEAPVPGYGSGPGYGPTLLPPREVYTVVRESGFSPLGIPRQHGLIYTIAVINRRGADGRLVIDARTGQILRFVPAYRLGEYPNNGAAPPYVATPYAPSGPLPPMSNLRDTPRPPAAVPKVASRMPPTVPLPKASPQRPDDANPLAEKPAPQPAQQSAAVQTKPADIPTTPQAAPPVVEAKPAAAPIQPTQEMPRMQGLE